MKKAIFLMLVLAVALFAVPGFAEEITIDHKDHGSYVPLKAYINEPQVVLSGAYDAPHLFGLQNDIPILSWLLDGHFLGLEAGKGFMNDPFTDSTRSWIEGDKGYYIVTKVTNTKCYFNCPSK